MCAPLFDHAALPHSSATLPGPWVVQFFHLVPAQSLRKAAASMPAASFEEVLAEVEARSQSHSHRGGHKAQQLPGVVLLRRPAVFTLAIVWESPQVMHLGWVQLAFGERHGWRQCTSTAVKSCSYRSSAIGR